MKKLIRKNPVGFIFVIVFLSLIVFGIATSKASVAISPAVPHIAPAAQTSQAR